MNVSVVLLNSLIMIGIIEAVFKLVVRRFMKEHDNRIKIFIVISVSFIFGYFTLEDGVLNRKSNLFETLDFDPFSPSEIISNKIKIYNNNRESSSNEFDLLIQKRFHDEYYVFGTMTINLSEQDGYIRKFSCILPYIFYFLIARVFCENEMKTSKRICSIFSILGALYEVNLFIGLNQKDIIVEMLPTRMALFEIVKYIHLVYALFFLITIGFDSIYAETEEKVVDSQNLKLFQKIAENQKAIQEKIDELDKKRTEKFENE